MEMVFYCVDCKKFFYAEAEADQMSSVCSHCQSNTTINCRISKEQYAELPEDRKNYFKSNTRTKYSSKDVLEKYLNQLQIERETARRREQLLGTLFTLQGARGRSIQVCKNKCIIKTSVTVGSVITGNATDGEKVIFYKDCSGLQFKKSGALLGYLQFETPSMQMNNQNSNFFSENTFTFDANSNGPGNDLMTEVFYYILELMELAKFPDTYQQPTGFPPLLANYLGKQDNTKAQ